MKRAFTLLEILLVVAIIAILAGIIIVAINPAKQLGNTRDSQRKSDINNLYKAVNQYLIDKGTPPLTITSLPQPICVLGQTSSGCIDLSALVPDYLTTIPVDPQASTYTGYYITKVDDNVYLEAPLTEIGFTAQPGYASSTAIAAFVGVLPSGYIPGVAGSGVIGTTTPTLTPPHITFNGSPLYLQTTDMAGMPQWGGFGTATGATSGDDGLANTALIVGALGDGTYAAKLCADSTFGGYTDWYLPAENQLIEMYNQKDTVDKGDYTSEWTDMAGNVYWSSTEQQAWVAYTWVFSSNEFYNSSKTTGQYVRCVR